MLMCHSETPLWGEESLKNGYLDNIVVEHSSFIGIPPHSVHRNDIPGCVIPNPLAGWGIPKVMAIRTYLLSNIHRFKGFLLTPFVGMTSSISFRTPLLGEESLKGWLFDQPGYQWSICIRSCASLRSPEWHTQMCYSEPPCGVRNPWLVEKNRTKSLWAFIRHQEM